MGAVEILGYTIKIGFYITEHSGIVKKCVCWGEEIDGRATYKYIDSDYNVYMALDLSIPSLDESTALNFSLDDFNETST